MRMIAQIQNSVTVEALVLAADTNLIRVVAAGRGETEEWVIIGGRLYDEQGRRIEIESVLALDGVDVSEILAAVHPKVMTAGHLSS